MDSTFKVNIIVATDLNRDTQNVCIFGRVTYESIHDPTNYEKLLKVVVTKRKQSKTLDRNLVFVCSLREGLDYLEAEKARRNIGTVWILGGATIYAEALKSPYLHRIYLTRVLKKFFCDTYFPDFDQSLYRIVSDSRVPSGIQLDNGVEFQVDVYEQE